MKTSEKPVELPDSLGEPWSRSKFLATGAMGLAALLAGLASCRRADGIVPTFEGRVVVIGGGAAGLYAAWLLKGLGIRVTVLEATDRTGGRMRSLNGWCSFPVDQGAEEVHGERSLWHRLAATQNTLTPTDNYPSYWHDSQQWRSTDDLEQDAAWQDVQTFLDGLENVANSGQSVEQAAVAAGIDARFLPYINAVTGNEQGTSFEKLSAGGWGLYNRNWDSGARNFQGECSGMYENLLGCLPGVEDLVETRAVVRRIDYTRNPVRITLLDGRVWEAERVLITASLGVLQKNFIAFEPPLSEQRKNAFSSMGMGEGMKIHLRFRERFWPSDAGAFYGNGMIPEFWEATGSSESEAVLCAFVNGASAAQLSAQPQGILAAALDDLERLFPGKAKSTYRDGKLMNWTTASFINGTYSYPIVGINPERALAGLPISNALYFAGEAYHATASGTVQGALETAAAAVKLMVQ
jgi:lysine-specific histone demethylase 1B